MVFTVVSAEQGKGALLVLAEDQTVTGVCDLGVITPVRNGGVADAVSLILEVMWNGVRLRVLVSVGSPRLWRHLIDSKRE